MDEKKKEMFGHLKVTVNTILDGYYSGHMADPRPRYAARIAVELVEEGRDMYWAYANVFRTFADTYLAEENTGAEILCRTLGKACEEAQAAGEKLAVEKQGHDWNGIIDASITWDTAVWRVTCLAAKLAELAMVAE